MATRRSGRAAPAALDASMRIVILRGPDQFLRAAYTRRLVEALEAAHGGIAQFAFDGASAEPAEVLDELRSYGLLQDHKLVIVDQADRFLAGRDDDTARRSTRALLERYAESPSDGSTLLLRAETWRPGRLDKAVAKIGAIVKCETPDAASAATWCVGRCSRAHGATISDEAASMLVERVGPELARLDSELAKLAAFVGPDGVIDADAVRTMVGLSREEQAWVVQSSLLSGRAAEAVAKVRELLEISRQPEQLLTWAMTDLLRKLHTAAHLRRRGEPAPAIARALRLWGAERSTLIERAERLGPDRCARLLDLAIRTDRANKSGRRDPRSLEVLAVRIADTISSA